MKFCFVAITLLLFSYTTWGQISQPIAIKWVDTLTGDYSFTKRWTYPPGIEMKSDGRAGCADGGFCPQRCYAMQDSNGIVYKDSAQVFYSLLDTNHLNITLQCESSCNEWMGSELMEVEYFSNTSVFCHTLNGPSTHSSLQMLIVENNCNAFIDLNSIKPKSSMVYNCNSGFITIDKTLWDKGILKAEFNFNFDAKDKNQKSITLKGKTYVKMKTP